MIRPYRDLWAIVETARCLALGTLLVLIEGQVQARLNPRMIEQLIVFATRHKREASHIGEHRSIAILCVEPQQRAFLRKVGGCRIPANGRVRLSAFLST